MRLSVLLALGACPHPEAPPGGEDPPPTEALPEPTPPAEAALPAFHLLQYGMDPADAVPRRPGDPVAAPGSPRRHVADEPVGYLLIEPPDRCYKVWLDPRRNAPFEWRSEHGPQGPIYVVPQCATDGCGTRVACPAFAAEVLQRLADAR
jgi:hypothetical protein